MWFEPEVGESWRAFFQQLIEYQTVPKHDGIAMIYRRCGYHALFIYHT
jgi:hypothetical protein